jgi:hypothetical protein
MSALVCYQGLEAVFRSIPGVRSVLLGEPTGDMDLPGVYTAYTSFTRPLRNNPPANNLTGMEHTFNTWLVIRWVENSQAEMQLLTLLDAIPDAIDADPRLGGRLTGGLARCTAGQAGYATIGGVLYRVATYTIEVLEKRVL